MIDTMKSRDGSTLVINRSDGGEMPAVPMMSNVSRKVAHNFYSREIVEEAGSDGQTGGTGFKAPKGTKPGTIFVWDGEQMATIPPGPIKSVLTIGPDGEPGYEEWKVGNIPGEVVELESAEGGNPAYGDAIESLETKLNVFSEIVQTQLAETITKLTEHIESAIIEINARIDAIPTDGMNAEQVKVLVAETFDEKLKQAAASAPKAASKAKPKTARGTKAKKDEKES